MALDIEPESPLDRAVSARLRKLAAMPVDSRSLEAAIERAIPRPRRGRPVSLYLRPIHALAASLVLGILIFGAVIGLTPRPVLASPQVLETIYHDGAMAMTEGSAPMDCCIQRVKGKTVTCMTLDSNGVRVSMAVADAKDFKVPSEAKRKDVNGVTYYVQSSPKINMVMTVKGETWMCLMGPVPENDLFKLMVKTPAPKPMN